MATAHYAIVAACAACAEVPTLLGDADVVPGLMSPIGDYDLAGSRFQGSCVAELTVDLHVTERDGGYAIADATGPFGGTIECDPWTCALFAQQTRIRTDLLSELTIDVVAIEEDVADNVAGEARLIVQDRGGATGAACDARYAVTGRFVGRER